MIVPNILITSAAAKVLLVRAFQEAVWPYGGRVFACDAKPESAALFAADEAAVVPRLGDAAFADALAALCAERKIALVVPTRDGELEALAALAPRLAAAGTRMLTAPEETLRRCRDKRLFNAFCLDHGYPVAKVFSDGEVPPFPVFVRPRAGAGGRGARRIDDEAAWNALGEACRDMVVQAAIEAPEYTVDTLLDLDGRPLQAVARRRLQVKAGEAVKSRVEDLPDLAAAALDLCARLGCIGHNVVQAFHTPQEGARFIEVNPRFGGASNLSIKAGLGSPVRIVQMIRGETEAAARPRPIAFGLTMLRHADDILVPDTALDAVPRVF
jgi:carbamoyl-phosphate synthase large subunit